jgi:hypothetical protein
VDLCVPNHLHCVMTEAAGPSRESDCLHQTAHRLCRARFSRSGTGCRRCGPA